MPKFTDLAIQSLPPGLHFDERTPSFGIRIGVYRKTWLVLKGDNRTKVRLGHYPDLSLAEARRKALVALGSPLAPKSSMSFQDAKAAFLALPRWKPRSLSVLESSLKHFAWTRQLDKITHEDVATALEAIKAPSARAHALKDIRTFFNWCVPRYLPSSPATGLVMDSQPTRSRVLSDEELVKVWRAAELIGYPFGHIVMMLILTGQRRSEIGSLRAEYIHGDRITLPPEVTKNGREHTFPLTVMAATLLPSLDGFVFRPTRDTRSATGHFNAWSKSHAALLTASGTKDWTLHDLRRTFSTKMAALKVRQEVTEKLLNHVSGSISGVAAIYNRHSYFEEMTEALALYETHLQTLLRKE